MARIYPLFSSSRGNATYVGTSEQGVLIDAGVTMRKLEQAMTRCKLSLSAIRGIFITHDHSDHVKGLKVLGEKLQVPIYAQDKTLRHLIDQQSVSEHARLTELNGPVTLAGITLQAFVTPHDTVQSCGFRITMPDGRVCAICTDLGHMTKAVHEALQGCDLVLIEANYDDAMLRNGRYPQYVKSRIRGDHGHLSNSDCAKLSRQLIESGTTRLILGHLSQENNRPELAEQAVVEALHGYVRGKDYLLEIAKVETTGEMSVF